MGFTDIRRDGLIGSLPYKWQSYAFLMRLDRPIGWWLLLLPGWWSIALAAGGIANMEFYQWYLLVLFFIGAIIMRGAGCVVNDLWDRDLDVQVERTRERPLASGAVNTWQAALFLSALLFFGFVLLVQMSALTIWLGIFSLILIAAYPYMKRITWWPQAFLGITFTFGALMGWSAVTGAIEWPAVFLYAGAFFWTLGYDTIYAHQDKVDDEIVGIKSTALLFGERSKKWVGIFYGAAWCLILIAAFLSGASIISLGLLLLPGVHMILQVLTWQMDDPHSSLKVFKSNMICGLLVFFAFMCA